MWSLKKTIKGVAGDIADALNTEHSPSGGYVPGGSAGKSKPKGNDNSGSSAGGNYGGSETANLTDTPPPLKTPTNEASANDPMTVLESYGKDLAAQQQEQAMQNLWDMASENYVFGRGDKHKATTLPTPADTPAAPEPDEETKKIYEVLGLEPPAVTKNLPDRIQQAWEDW